MIILFIILGLVGFCVLAVIALGFFGWSFAKRAVGPIAGCAISFEAARQGILEYAKEHDGRLPKAETWQDDIRQYVVKHLNKERDAQNVIGAKTMKPDGDWGCYVSDTKMTGMAFNVELSGKLLTDVKDPYSTIVIFEIDAPKKNAAEKYQTRPTTGSPTLMGNPRGWIAMPLEGGMRGLEEMNEGGRWRTSTPEGGDESSSSLPAGTPEPDSK